MLQLDSYLSTDAKNRFSDQEIVVILYLPEGSVVKFSNNTSRYLSYDIDSNYVNQYLNITEDGLVCNDCDDDEFEIDVDTPNMKIDESGIEIKSDKSSLKIDNKGINAESEDVKVNINSEGVSVKSEN
jgi:hypothetical protein